jgi:hypothetical protein
MSRGVARLEGQPLVTLEEYRRLEQARKLGELVYPPSSAA